MEFSFEIAVLASRWLLEPNGSTTLTNRSNSGYDGLWDETPKWNYYLYRPY